MKKIMALFTLFCVSLAASAVAQGAFQNLNFESANLPVIPSGQTGSLVPINLAFPGWTATDGVDTFQQVFHNNSTLGSVSIDILGPNWQPQGAFHVISGNYTAVLQAGEGIQGPVSAILEQSGQVPVFAKSILFDAVGTIDNGQLTLDFNGQSLPFALLSSGPNFDVYGADISTFAGRTGMLSFSENPVGQSFFGTALLDDISFSPSAAPEPSTWTLMAVCGVSAFAFRRWMQGRISFGLFVRK